MRMAEFDLTPKECFQQILSILTTGILRRGIPLDSSPNSGKSSLEEGAQKVSEIEEK